MSFAVPSIKARRRAQSAGDADDSHAAGRAAVEIHDALTPAPYFNWHLLPQRCLALLLLAPALPIMLLLVGLVRLTSRGPGIYRQTRVGLAGRTFQLYKLRSMRQDAEARSGAVWAQLRGDPRVTRFGRFLRASHLDELPQLFNVLKGEMALVGPRPERPEFTHKLALEIPRYMERHRVRPGITGLAQINLPPDTDLDSVRRKLVFDLEHIRTATLGYDLRICMVTGLRVIGIRGRAVRLVLGVAGPPMPALAESRLKDPVERRGLASKSSL
jgi:lipopolysaccharide/colanic/teichoic acid biosynthesis glycosyltransferase